MGKQDSLVETILSNMRSKSTEELVALLENHDGQEYSEEAFEAARQVLQERGVAIPRSHDHSQARDETQTGTPETAPTHGVTHRVKPQLQQAYAYVGKRQFKEAARECEAVLKQAPDLAVAQALRRMIQERQTLYTRGGGSLLFGFLLLYRVFGPAASSGQSELTGLGWLAVGLGTFLLLEGFVVALSGMRLSFLVDGIAICLVGLWNLDVSLFTGATDWLFAGLGAAQLVWGGFGIVEYFQKQGLNYREVREQIGNLTEDSDPGLEAQGVTPEAQAHFDRAKAFMEKGKSRDGLRECEFAIQLAPRWAEAYNLRGLFLDLLKRRAEALEAYREAVRLDPAFTEARQNLDDAEAESRRTTIR